MVTILKIDTYRYGNRQFEKPLVSISYSNLALNLALLNFAKETLHIKYALM